MTIFRPRSTRWLRESHCSNIGVRPKTCIRISSISTQPSRMPTGVASESPQKRKKSRLCLLHLWKRKSKNNDLRWWISWWSKTLVAVSSPSVTLRNCQLLTGAVWSSRRMSSITKYKKKRLSSWTRQEMCRRRRSGHNWKLAARLISSSNKISRCKAPARNTLFSIGSQSKWESKKMSRFSKFKKRKPKKA